MSNLPEIEGISVVFLGDFNPAIFHPEWFARQGLISDPDLKDSNAEVVTGQLAIVKLGEIRLLAQPKHFQLETVSLDLLPVVRDLAIGTLQYLEHTPIRSMGFNRHMHFKMASSEEWHAVGHVLTPKDIWSDLMGEPGMLSVQMQGKRDGASSSHVRVQVQPSNKVQPGVYVGINEQYESTTGGPDALKELLQFLSSEWEASHQYGRETAMKLLRRCEE